ncbi:MAG: Gfo/Idh/MocA family oxidoreductase [Planctomycetota bacterium]
MEQKIAHRLPGRAWPRLRIGLVGAGRSRQGLGPFLAKWFEHHGAVVAGIAGRNEDRTRAVAVSLTEQLGHEVRSQELHELAQSVDALVVACPVEGHLAGLDAALAAGVPCLCEKPLVSPDRLRDALERIEQFRQRGLLLAENCQWPFTLDAVQQLHPELLDRSGRSPRRRRLAMRLSPAWPGRTMVEDSLSHVLSLAQAIVPLSRTTQLEDLRAPNLILNHEEQCEIAFRLVDGGHEIDVTLCLECCPQQPRPAWFELDGVRFDRRIGDSYAISFVSSQNRTANVEDPLSRLVYGFLQDLTAEPRERTRADDVELRIRLYASVLAAIG